MATNLTLSIQRRWLLDLRPSANIGQAAGGGLPQLNQTWGPQEQEVPNQAACDLHDQTLLYVLNAPLATVQKFATTCDWLMLVAIHVFGDRHGALEGPIGTHIANPAATQLAAINYVFFPVNQNSRSIFLMRRFSGLAVSVPELDQSGGGNKLEFTGNVQHRESNECKISGFSRLKGYKNFCSHIIPKRLGPHVVKHIIYRLTDAFPVWGHLPLHWDPRVAVLLLGVFDGFLDGFTMGFYRATAPTHGNSQYHVHHFDFPILAQDQVQHNMQGWTKLAIRWDDVINIQVHNWENRIADLNLHGLTVNFPLGQTNLVFNPTFEVLGWHYVQCVMRKWATADYRNYPNINW